MTKTKLFNGASIACLSFILLPFAGLAQAPTPPLVNIGIFTTAVRDSFEVRIFSDASIPQTQGLMNATFTLRWDVAAGGTVDVASLAVDCGEYALVTNGEPVQSDGSYNYYTLNINGSGALGTTCPITTSGAPIAGFRMTNFTGCAALNIVDDGYTGSNNKDFYLSLGGIDRTGSIYSTPLVVGFPADINADGTVDVQDFLSLNGAFGNSCTGCPEDINDDGTVDVQDFLSLNGAFGTSCP